MFQSGIKTASLKVVVYWTVVLIPLGWGVYQSVLKSLPLFDRSVAAQKTLDATNR